MSDDRAAALSGHHFPVETGEMYVVGDLVCAGCGRTLRDLAVESRAARDGMSRCPTPHEDAESGQVMRIAEGIA